MTKQQAFDYKKEIPNGFLWKGSFHKTEIWM